MFVLRSAFALLFLLAPVSVSANSLMLYPGYYYGQLFELRTGSLVGEWSELFTAQHWMEFKSDVRGVYFFDILNADTMEPIPGVSFLPSLIIGEPDGGTEIGHFQEIAERCDSDGCRNAVLILEVPNIYAAFGVEFGYGPLYDVSRVTVRIRQYLDASLDEFGQPSGAPDGELHLFFVPEPGVAALLALGLAALGAHQRAFGHRPM